MGKEEIFVPKIGERVIFPGTVDPDWITLPRPPSLSFVTEGALLMAGAAV